MAYSFNFIPVFLAWDRLLDGVQSTLKLSFSAMAIGLAVALVCAIGKTSGPKFVGILVTVYVELVRNTPFLVQIFFIYFVLPLIGLRLSPNSAALLALVVNVGAYAAEIIRAGILSIQKGQVEAGIALGLKPLQIMRFIIINPALRTIYPALTSQFIYLMLTTSVVSVISGSDLSSAAADIQSESFASFEVYLVVTLIYLLLSFGFSALFSMLGRIFFSYPLTR